MTRKYKAITKDTIVSTRISDDEMYNIKQLMDLTNLSASEIMRKAFHMQIERFKEIEARNGSCSRFRTGQVEFQS